MFDRHIIEEALPKVEHTPVAHYTRIGTLCHFIPHGTCGWGSAWATPVQFLNDRMDLLLGLEELLEAANQPPRAEGRVRYSIEQLRVAGGALETDAFQLSFSGDPDELGQWRGYAANGMGCAVITDAVAVKKVGDVAGWVIYDPRERDAFASKTLERLRKETDDRLIQQALVASASYMKHEGFSPEKEFRLLKFADPEDVKFRERDDRLVPYIDCLDGASPLPVDRILIGPGWQLSRLSDAEKTQHHVVQGIQRLLTARGLNSTDIGVSKIPYDPR